MRAADVGGYTGELHHVPPVQRGKGWERERKKRENMMGERKMAGEREDKGLVGSEWI